jgi:hypothetical protein
MTQAIDTKMPEFILHLRCHSLHFSPDFDGLDLALVDTPPLPGRKKQQDISTSQRMHQLLTDKTSTSDNADTPSDSVDGTSPPPSDF